jgi:uncharacterized membrane-anchored protein
MSMRTFFTTTLARRMARKVPEVLVYFWIVKVLTTAMGESTSDYLVNHIDPVVAVILGGIGFAIAITLQLRAQRYLAWVYWLAVTMVAIFGTMVADVVHIVLGVPYQFSTIAFAIVLALLFALWYRSERTLSIHSITTPRRELFYWATVCTTFALGTATGDMTANTFGLGYLGSGILFGILFALPLIAARLLGANAVFAFWFAYIMTRPFGASFADWFGRTPSLGGLGFGTGKTSIILTMLIIISVAYLAVTRKDSKGAAE